MKVILVIAYLILTVSGLVFMKLGGNPGTFALKDGTMTLGMSTISAVGFVCYLFSFLLFTRLVVMFDLSYIFPICTGIVQILTLIASAVIFKENISLTSAIGAGIVIIGIIIMNIKQIQT